MTPATPFSMPPGLAAEPADAGTRAEQLVRLVYWTSAAGRQLRRCLANLAGSAGLTDCELLTVWLCLGDAGGMVQGELAAALGVSPAQMSGVAERLRQRGLIEMHRQTLDRRRQVWRGTTAARQLFESLAAALAALGEGLAASLSAADQQRAQALCRGLSEAVDVLPSTSGANDDNVTTRTENRSSCEAA